MTRQNAFLRIVSELVEMESSTANTNSATSAFRRALLDFGSDTEDNLSCASEMGIATHLEDEGEQQVTGLTLLRQGRLVSEILNEAEGTPIPAEVRQQFPDLDQRGWDAVLRTATLVFVALEKMH